MKRAKRRARRARTRHVDEVAAAMVPKLAPPAVSGPSGLYVKLPLPPELLAAVEEHAANASRLRDLFTRADASVLDLGRACVDAAQAIERDVSRVRRALKKRR